MSETIPRFAFVLFASPPALDVDAIVCAHTELSPLAPAMLASDAKPTEHANTTTFVFADGKGEIILSSIAAAIPAREAEAAAEFSVSRFSGTAAAPVSQHQAHVIVALVPWEGSSCVDQAARLSWAVAALAKAAGALAVYWGSGGATHPAEFFIDVARNSGGTDDAALLPIWLGVSLTSEAGGASFLTLGMQEQFALPDLRLWSPQHGKLDALAFMFDLTSYVIGRHAPVASGETVGRTPDERLVVRYEPSPIGGSTEVMRVDLPS